VLKKAYSRGGRVCKVTFEIPAQVEANTAHLCGDFNGWDKVSLPMERKEDGGFQLTIPIRPGRRYSFRYLLDGERWQNDWAADSFAPNPFGTEDSVVEA